MSRRITPSSLAFTAQNVKLIKIMSSLCIYSYGFSTSKSDVVIKDYARIRTETFEYQNQRRLCKAEKLYIWKKMN